MRLRLILPLLTLFFIAIACGKENAANKIKESNLETALTRDAEIKKGGPTIEFDATEYDFGTVNEGDIVETTFKLTNTGKTNLIITDAKASCGCTVPEWPRGAVKPGDEAEIKVKFNTSGKPNRQIKSITLYTNTDKGRETLKLKGVVTPKSSS